MSLPLLTVCIPTFNRAPYLASLLRRLAVEIGDVRAFVEVVVSDNASDDETPAICAAARADLGEALRYFRQDENIGGPRNLQFAIGQAKGLYCVYLADDDILLWPAVLEALGILRQNGNAIALYAPYNVVDLETGTGRLAGNGPPEMRVFSARDRAGFAKFVVEHRIFSEIAIFRTDVIRRIVPLLSNLAHWAFTVPSELLAFGEVIYNPTPFYGWVSVHPGMPERSNAGTEEVQLDWDWCRGAMEHVIGLAAESADPSELAEMRLKAERFVQDRMLQALRFRLHLGKDPVESYLLASRLRGLGRLQDLPLPLDQIRTQAALSFLTTRLAAMHGAEELLLVGAFGADIEKVVSDVSRIPVRRHEPGIVPAPHHIALVQGSGTIEDMPADLDLAGYAISERDLLAKFP